MSATPRAERHAQDEETEIAAVATPGSGAPGSSGHRGSLRGANKLARRARSFKDDLLERINNMRSPATNAGANTNASVTLRCQSPLSPRSRGSGGSAGRLGSGTGAQTTQPDEEHNPSKDLELLVRQVRFDLKHFCDVISKKKLEMLPGNGTIVLDTITNIHTAIRPYVTAMSVAGAANNSGLSSALTRLCEALARLIRLCDEALLSVPTLSQEPGAEPNPDLPCPALQQDNVNEVVGGVQAAVEELSRLALVAMCGRPALAPRGALTTGSSVPNPPSHSTPPPRHSHNDNNGTQRNSLPDIPLTPRERQSLRSVTSSGDTSKGHSTGSIGMPSRSTDSVVEAVSVEDNRPIPPPKPPRPDRSLDMAPPLPPKKKGIENSFLGLSAVDRMSLQSHSSGSLDSMLNVSNDEEIRVIMEQNSNMDDSSIHHLTPDILAICSCPSAEGYSQSQSNRVSMDSTSTNQSSSISAERPSSNGVTPGNTSSMAIQKVSDELVAHSTTNHVVNQNRLSNESGFVSMGNTRCSEISYASFNSTQRSVGFSEVNSVISDMLTDGTIANHRQIVNNGVVSAFEMSSMSHEKSAFKTESLSIQNISHSHTSVSQTAARAANIDITIDGSTPETPPALPAKMRRNLLTAASLPSQPPSIDVTDFQTIEFRDHVKRCAIHGAGMSLELAQRPHTLMDPPPPLPLKKKHIMAYMEMFGNCSHPPNANLATMAAANAAEMYRHSIHTYNLSSHQHQVMSQNKQLHILQSGQQLSQTQAMHHFNTISTSHFSPRVSPLPAMAPPLPTTPQPPALPPKMNKLRQQVQSISQPPLPPLAVPATNARLCSPAETSISSNNSSSTENHMNSSNEPIFEITDVSEEVEEPTGKPGRFPVDDSELNRPPESEDSLSSSPLPDGDLGQEVDIVLAEDVSTWLVLKESSDDGPEIRGGHPDALIVHATKASKDFAYQEAFLATYRTFVSPYELVCRLARRHTALTTSRTSQSTHAITGRRREVQSLLARVVSDLTTSDLDGPLLELILEFVYGLVCSGDLSMAKALRVIILEKYRQQQALSITPSPMVALTARRETLLDFKSAELAEQMTLLDAALFTRIAVAEVLAWTREQSEDRSPNLTRFTEHFNKMSYWARSRILEQEEAKDREKYVVKFIKVMKHLRKINNFNSYLALLSALDSAPVRRLEWPRHVGEALADYCALIDSSSSFRAYRQALADTHPPCIPYIGLVLQDLTFVHIGNSDLMPNGAVNFSKRWQQYHIVENMKRFNKGQYTFKKSERITAMFNAFDDVLSEEAMWQISETIKPRGGRKQQQNNATANGAVAVHDG